ncbi:MAG TPA: protein translocase subunit SecF [Longimicrobiaceae bacterium]|nr:protein translocase subunit SecF [Longimicrobiaceae bacterium]
MRLFENARYPFMEWRKRAYIFTAVVLVLGIGAMLYNAATLGSWLNYGVDFTGGTLVQVNFKQPTTVDEIRATAARGGHSDWQIARFEGGDEFVIRMPSFEQEAGVDASARVTQGLSSRYQPTDFNIVRTEAVGPKVGNELQQRALLAILLSFVATLIYLWFRFEWRFGLAAIIATAHDILITLGFLAFTRTEISLATVAALLTIVGYSLNDTIVVFDRVRENLAKPRKAGASYMQLLDTSINETLSRTVLTGGSTLATLLALYLFGGAVIRDFAMVLILGIIIGTFSSIFVASPALFEIEKRWPKFNVKGGPSRAGASTARTRSASSTALV